MASLSYVSQIAELIAGGFSKEEAEAAILMSVSGHQKSDDKQAMVRALNQLHRDVHAICIQHTRIDDQQLDAGFSKDDAELAVQRMMESESDQCFGESPPESPRGTLRCGPGTQKVVRGLK